MEYAAHGELYELLITNGALPSDVARDIFKQILSAVHHSMLPKIMGILTCFQLFDFLPSK